MRGAKTPLVIFSSKETFLYLRAFLQQNLNVQDIKHYSTLSNLSSKYQSNFIVDLDYRSQSRITYFNLNVNDCQIITLSRTVLKESPLQYHLTLPEDINMMSEDNWIGLSFLYAVKKILRLNSHSSAI